MKILIDMNLSPEWVEVLERHEWTAVHWSTVGDPRAEDTVLMDWARTNDYVVFTHDLDFGALLALTQAESPSVIQVRTQDVTPSHLAPAVIDVLQRNASLLEAGALIVLDEGRSRVRILPLALRPIIRRV
jgi:predicted nuclease of predicted toxin-antitoxin system